MSELGERGKERRKDQLIEGGVEQIRDRSTQTYRQKEEKIDYLNRTEWVLAAEKKSCMQQDPYLTDL